MSNVTLDWPQDYNKVPKEAFTRHDIYKAELEQIFYGPEWHPIAHAAEIPNKGDFKTTRLATVPLIVSHGQDGNIRVFFNSCSHRGNQVETALRGNKKEFECPYHRWLFNTEGDLIGCPNAKEIPNRNKAIKYAVSNLQKNDLLLIAGKGHETFQAVGIETLPFDDYTVAKEAIKNIEKAGVIN